MALSKRAWLTLGHWLALLLLIVSVWSGLNIALDQRPWLQQWMTWWPGMDKLIFYHTLAAGLWGALLIVYIVLHILTKKKNAPPVQLPRRHVQSKWQIYFAVLSLVGTGSILLMNVAGSWTYALRWLHFSACFLLIGIVFWHIWVEWVIGAWPRIRTVFFQLSLRKKSTLLMTLGVLLSTSFGTLVGLHWWQSSLVMDVNKVSVSLTLDGELNEAEWAQASSTIIPTYYGAPYDKTVAVDIKLMHDGNVLYMHARWPDASLSREHLPLVKTEQGWKVQQSNYLNNDEQQFYEDKFAVMIGSSPWDALRSVFLSQKEGRGGHVMAPNEFVDIWHWKSVRNHDFVKLDDAYFGAAQVRIPGQRRYAWGYVSDDLEAGGFAENWACFKTDVVTPFRLPQQAQDIQTFQATEKNPVMGISWYTTQPYKTNLDTYPIGTKMPSVLWYFPNEGDRGSVHAAGVWKDGYWNLEMMRNFEVDSKFDKKIEDGVSLWFATFDHTQIRHTYHLQPLRLRLGK